MGHPGEVTDATWDEKVLQSEQPVFIDFWAPWCGPCRMVAPIVDELADEYEGKVTFLKMDTDENPRVATELGIRSIPAMLVFKGGQQVQSIIGFQPKKQLKAKIDAAL